MKETKIKKERVWMNVDKKILDWVRKKILDKTFGSETHCFECLVMEKIKKGRKNA